MILIFINPIYHQETTLLTNVFIPVFKTNNPNYKDIM